MSCCPECGAAGAPESQCSRCGAYISPDAEPPPLELDTAALERAPKRGVSGPTRAQVAAAGGDSQLEVERVARRAPRATIELAQQTAYAEQERARRTLFWRATRTPVLLILGWFTLSHLAFDSAWVFLDNFDLVLHEAGHWIWGWGGPGQAALGGTVGQLMWPLIFTAYFYHWHPDRFAMWCCVWWFGQNFMSISRYMNDAAAMQLPLVGGDQHDWNFLFKRWHVLDKTNEIARFFHGLGALIMIAALAWLVWRTVNPDRYEIDQLD